MHREEVAKVIRRQGQGNHVPLCPIWLAHELVIDYQQELEKLLNGYSPDLIFAELGIKI